jgi:hypothetical protein
MGDNMATFDFKYSTCRRCRRFIIWAVSNRGAPVILDRDPAPDGTVALMDRDWHASPLAKVLSVAERFGRSDLRVIHTIACPTPKIGRGRRS